MGLCEIYKSLILKGDNLNVTEVHSTGLYCTVLEMGGKSINLTAT